VLKVLNVLNVLNVLKVLNVLNVLNVLFSPYPALSVILITIHAADICIKASEDIDFPDRGETL